MTAVANGTNGTTKTNGTHTVKASEILESPQARLETFAKGRTARGGEFRFELRQMLDNGEHTTVDSFHGPDPKALADRAFQAARDDARAFTRRTRYELVALDPDGRREGRCAFNCDGSSTDGVREAESPTPAALILQVMRSNEALFDLGREGIRQNMSDSRAVNETLVKMNAQLQRDNERLTNIIGEYWELRDKLAREAATNDEERERARAKDERITKFGGQFLEMAMPILKARLAQSMGTTAHAQLPATPSPAPASSPAETAGPTPAPAPSSAQLSPAECAAVLDFLGSLDQATFLKVSSVLTDEQNAKLFELASLLQRQS